MKKLLLALSLLFALFLISCGSPTETEVGTSTLCEHTEKEQTSRTEAKPLAEGSITYTCKACGFTETEIIPATHSIKVLAIGNSFSVDAVAHLQGLMKAAGVKDFVIGNMSVGGCSLDKHWGYAQSGEEAYGYTKYTNSGKTSKTTNLDTVLTDERWDVVVLQQVSNTSGVSASYTKLENLIDFVSDMSLNPDLKIMWHMTWAYQGDATKSAFATYKNDQMTMYNAIADAVETQVLAKETIADVIPSGTAVQNLRTSYIGDTLTRDGTHMSYDLGRYTVGLTWLVKLTGASLDDLTWVPTDYPLIKNDLDAIKEAVMNAIEIPLAVTQSQYIEASYERPAGTETPAETEAPAKSDAPTGDLTLVLVPGPDDGELFQTLGLDLGEYTLLDWDPTYRAFWNSQSGMKLSTAESDTSLKYIGSRLIEKAELPIGSVIVVDEGYRYRPEAWVDSSTRNGSDRPATTDAEITLVDDAWWGNYNYRAFNLSRADKGNIATDEADRLRIYVPANQ